MIFESNPGATSAFMVEQHPRGVVVRPGVPVGLLSSICDHYRGEGFHLMAADLCAPLRAAFVLVRNEADHAAWREEVKTTARRRAGGDAEIEWLTGPDTGISSRTIFSVLSDRGELAKNVECPLGSPPWDPDDFGRCHRLLALFPSWRERLHEVAAEHPIWAPLVENWSELESLWNEESPARTCPKLYARMRALLRR